VDFVGAGDTFHAAIAACLTAGGRAEEAAFLGNLAASVTVAKIGTTGTATPEEILDRYRQYAEEASG
jgi:bifunctional ADP-heptose synthase (sugar kinase/adenylyltransferase)